LNPCLTLVSSFFDDFLVASDSVFVDDFEAHMGCLRCRMHASPVEAVSLMLSETLGLFALSNPCVTSRKSFVEDF
jgi:hypothetical protein